MKRFSTIILLRVATYLILLALVVLAMFGFCARDRFYEYFSQFDGVEFCYIYDCQNNDINASSKLLSSAHIMKNGHYLFVYSNEISYKNAKFKQGKIRGDYAKYVNIINNLKLKNIRMEKIGNIIATFGFASEFGEFRWVEGQKVNLHIVYSNGEITFGSPLIYGSY